MALGTLSVILLLMFSFAVGPNIEVLREHAAAYLWLVVFTTSTLLLNQSFHVETESNALEALLLLPADPRALYYAKAVANTAALLGVVAVSTPVAAVLCDVSLQGSPGQLVAVAVLGCAGLAAPGTFYAGLTARVPAQQVMLPLLLFPLLVPVLLASVEATSVLLEGDPMGQAPDWIALLVVFDVLFWILCGLLFPRLVEE